MRCALVAVVLAVAVGGCGGGDAVSPERPAEGQDGHDPGPVHVHGLGVNPADGALFVATHTGLFRVAPDAEKAARVGDSRQDTMGFTVVGRDHFLGSGHPDPREAAADDLPPHLGLIESRDAGRSWENVSLAGEADFHVLRAQGDHVYGLDASGGRFLASTDGGRSWEERQLPGPAYDVVVDATDPLRLIAATQDEVAESRDGGRSWRPVGSAVAALLAWPQRDRLYAVLGDGFVRMSRDGGRTWRELGSVGGEPAAFAAAADELHVALHDGTIKRSGDGGRTWRVRSQP